MTVQLTAHFRQRVTERLPGIDPDTLAASLWDEVSGNTGRVRYAGRCETNRGSVSRYARRFEFNLQDGSVGRVVIDDNKGCPVFITAWRDMP